MTGDQMKFLKFATIVALAMLPLILIKKKSQEVSQPGREVDSDEIFDAELTND